MIVDVSKKILIVGLGLLGGSYARVLKRFGFHISAITKEQSSIDYAINEGIIDEGSTELDEEIIGNADLVIFALYPHVFVEWIENNQKLLKSGAIITDVTGVKRSIVYKIQDILRDDVEFIAAHPMAGREVSGVENSTDKMFQGANYIVTPTDKNTPEAINTCLELGRLLGFSNVTTLSPEEHDEMIGFLSQLTHCIAITLMTCNDRENMEKFTGDSFRDLTRIARINDLMWSELFVANKDALLSQMDMFMDKFKELKTMLETEDIDGMRKMMRHSTDRRALFDKK
ncbi:MAG: prephenate dehydrogenase/arogenate dehydrogenase family protein [Acutalibacteraceae bacterium]|nr:prephenate dehydrogenase/arogenate dehydrogenase family protein [Acutalibacteraceae bacterium]MEE0897303.1 prephenate dehydrogenase/arogenate dehydrogenase family protein [Acutalibacteraceae bacterium]MEE1504436.1 prephenate dehydrogenase/arogenate dehydrogenase family protein [Acutalibacteraceae bacterium]